jgi:hypothetical protein
MLRTIVIFVCLVFFLALAACDKAVDSRDAAKPPQPEGEAGHAAEGVQAGSHEDWCGEHRVPESLCTRCNPALVAAFKASGDWCTEHGLPESQCLACNPDLKIERPPKIEGN